MSENSLLKQITATYGYTRFWKVEICGPAGWLRRKSRKFQSINETHLKSVACAIGVTLTVRVANVQARRVPIPQTAAEVRPSRHAAHDQGGCVNPADPNTCFPTKRHTLRR